MPGTRLSQRQKLIRRGDGQQVKFTEAPTGRMSVLFTRPVQICGCVLGVCWFGVLFRAWVLVPGVGDVASALTGRAALAVGRLSHPLITKLVFFFQAAEPPLPLLHDRARA